MYCSSLNKVCNSNRIFTKKINILYIGYIKPVMGGVNIKQTTIEHEINSVSLSLNPQKGQLLCLKCSRFQFTHNKHNSNVKQNTVIRLKQVCYKV